MIIVAKRACNDAWPVDVLYGTSPASRPLAPSYSLLELWKNSFRFRKGCVTQAAIHRFNHYIWLPHLLLLQPHHFSFMIFILISNRPIPMKFPPTTILRLSTWFYILELHSRVDKLTIRPQIKTSSSIAAVDGSASIISPPAPLTGAQLIDAIANVPVVFVAIPTAVSKLTYNEGYYAGDIKLIPAFRDIIPNYALQAWAKKMAAKRAGLTNCRKPEHLPPPPVYGDLGYTHGYSKGKMDFMETIRPVIPKEKVKYWLLFQRLAEGYWNQWHIQMNEGENRKRQQAILAAYRASKTAANPEWDQQTGLSLQSSWEKV
ncbi:hypothetical protein GQ43DRAFT_429326 [Delitschia confertaspora ATCC 74209]|uniref:Uncharacterized protein n=1 Tax=Delitschia confertaspora ATCC 74209 TaxID=1513339 RepID=A0A9P4MVE9_9PLEO|nr:hypothetical protein GQ43DRAFT_429326 [Delitschia confertaspora ATCC 74209]